MHLEILSKNQSEMLPLLDKIPKVFGLVEGTAIALQIGHRQSIDFDFFSTDSFDVLSLENQIRKIFSIEQILFTNSEELTFLTNSVKLTFLHYPFQISFTEDFTSSLKTPNLLTLGAMKAFAITRRAKWKDYVDFYFILKDHYSLTDITTESKKIFGSEFNEKILRASMSYFKDINYTEEVIYIPDHKTENQQIQDELIKISLS